MGLPPADPYDWIREWWGDELSPNLLQLICAAPRDQRLQFGQDYLARALQRRMPARQPGQVRPYCELSYTMYGSDSYSVTSGRARLRALALYCHQVVVEDPVARALMLAGVMDSDEEEHWLGSPVLISATKELREALTILLEFEPLHQMGAVIWTTEGYFSQAIQGRMVLFLPSEIDAVAAGRADKNLADGGWSAEFRNATDVQVARWLNQMDLSILVASSSQGSMEMLVPGRATQDALDAYCRIVGPVISEPSRGVKAQQLAMLADSISVPSTSDIARLRSSSELFSEWRDSLADGLREVSELPYTNGNWLIDARGTMNEALAVPRERIRAELASNSLSSQAHALARGLGVSAIGGSIGTAIGGGAFSAVAGSIASAGVGIASEYLRSLFARRKQRALLDYYLLFTQDQ